MVILMLTVLVIPLSIHAVQTQSSRPSAPPGFPGDSVVSSVGESLVSPIMQSAQFKALSLGVSYHVKSDSSFGYSWGPNIHSTETVTLFAPDNSSSVVTVVDLVTNQIQTMYFVNDTRAESATIEPVGYSVDYGGYGVLAYNGIQVLPVEGAEGSIEIPASITAPPAGETHACCQFVQWTGTTETQSGYQLTQGGVWWTGFNQPIKSTANSYGFSLFVEYVPSPSNPGSGPQFYTPPSWMGNVQGETIFMETEPPSTCSNGSGDLWYQFWNYGSNWMSQQIECIPHSSQSWGWFVFESPFDDVNCANGGYYAAGHYFCQIPEFAQPQDGVPNSVEYYVVRFGKAERGMPLTITATPTVSTPST